MQLPTLEVHAAGGATYFRIVEQRTHAHLLALGRAPNNVLRSVAAVIDARRDDAVAR